MKISLRDPLWQFIGVVVAICIFIAFYLLQRNYKELSYEIIFNSPLLSSSKELEGKIQITFDGKPVSNIQLVEIKLINSGNVPITKADYEREVIFNFGDKAKILTADVAKTEPNSIKIWTHLLYANNFASFNGVLLNPGDKIFFKFLLTEFDGRIIINNRISGIKDINEIRHDKTYYSLISVTIGMFLTMLAFSLGRLVVYLYGKHFRMMT